MKRKYTNRQYLDALQEKVLIFDGAMGTNLQNLNLTIEEYGGEVFIGCNDYLVISYPEAVEAVHRSFLEVGVDVIETDTFRANRISMTEYGLQDKINDINQRAARIARKLADEFSCEGQQRFVAGSIGPSGKLPSMDDPELSDISFDELSDIFCEQAIGLIEGGVDVLLIETAQDILEVKAAITGIHQAFELTCLYLPIQVQVTLDTTGRMLLGTDIAAVLTILENLPIDVIGLNCSTGPKHMREPIHFLGEQSTLPVSAVPNAGLPQNINGNAVFPLEPGPFADQMAEFVEKYGVSVVGGCCGTTPQHLRLLVNRLQGHISPKRPNRSIPRLASATQAMPMIQEPRPFLIGERLNTQGSRKFKRLILEEDFDSVISIARQQVDKGAHALDICVALTERSDEAELMHKVIKKLTPVIQIPLVIDSTEPEVLEAALTTAPGRCLINSIHLENGQERTDKILSLAEKYNAAVIALTIDEDGMAKTAKRKLQVAQRIYEFATNEHTLKPYDLVFDTLTFTLATGDPEFSNAAIDTLEGIRRIKAELPGVFTSLGISNVSFGLPFAARSVVNSVMLNKAVQAGLDMAIVNPAFIIPYGEIAPEERKMAEDLIFNRHPNALQRIIDHFENASTKIEPDRDCKQAAIQAMTAEQRLHWRILFREKDGVEQDIDEILTRVSQNSRHQAAIGILNSILLPSMKEVGEKFSKGEMILPFVLQSAEVMSKSMTHLEQYLEKKEDISKGTMVLATVYGDVHDIGKNLVKTILSNNGYEVIDLGKQVPAETIISKAIEVDASAIGLSALLVSTSKQMPIIVNELQRRRLHIPVLIGGAAINPRFGRQVMLTDQGTFYKAGVFYCKDAFDCLAIMDVLNEPESSMVITNKIRREAENEHTQANTKKTEHRVHTKHPSIETTPNIPQPPSWGPQVVNKISLDAVFECLSRRALFRLSWGAYNTNGEARENLLAEFETRLDEMRRQAFVENWLHPKGAYGYWPAQSGNNELIVYEPDSVRAGSPIELMRFKFPRQSKNERLCLADYFATIDSGIMDVAIFQIVTIGPEATERFDRLQEAGNYMEAYFTHGLAVQMAEASAEYLHRHIRNELKLPPDCSKRYSWGYPSLPELSDHQKVFQLLPAERELGMNLTSAYQFVPEQSTAAIIVHHSDAKYFIINNDHT